ncbi:MAG: hypothetical protein ACYS80_27740 [Planctomycetota bacterium]|jgi:hypothetical protein
MTAEGIIQRLSEYFSWLYYQQWGKWALLAIAMTALALVIVAAKVQARSQD